jgi:hypothetical protein
LSVNILTELPGTMQAVLTEKILEITYMLWYTDSDIKHIENLHSGNYTRGNHKEDKDK